MKKKRIILVCLLSGLFMLSIGLMGCDKVIDIDEREYNSYTAKQFLKAYPKYGLKVYGTVIKDDLSRALRGRIAAESYISFGLLDKNNNNKTLQGISQLHLHRYYSLDDQDKIVVLFTKERDRPIIMYVRKEGASAADRKSFPAKNEKYDRYTANEFLKKYPEFYLWIDNRVYRSMSGYERLVIENILEDRPVSIALSYDNIPGNIKDGALITDINTKVEIGRLGIMVEWVNIPEGPLFFHVPKDFSEKSEKYIK